MNLIRHMDSKDGFDVLRHTQSITLREGFRSPSDICAYAQKCVPYPCQVSPHKPLANREHHRSRGWSRRWSSFARQPSAHVCKGLTSRPNLVRPIPNILDIHIYPAGLPHVLRPARRTRPHIPLRLPAHPHTQAHEMSNVRLPPRHHHKLCVPSAPQDVAAPASEPIL